MEEEEKINLPQMTPAESKKKSHGICSLLHIRKKKVGCLPSSSDVSLDDSPGPSSQNTSPLHKSAFHLPPAARLNKSASVEHKREEERKLKRSDAVAKSCSSTNVALCCAITESSRTPIHFQSDFKLRYNNFSATGINRRSILTRMNGHSEDSTERLPPSGLDTKLKKPASETNILAKAKRFESNARKCLFGKSTKSHKRSCSLGKSVFNSNASSKVPDSLPVEASHSASDISPQSSPSPVEPSHTRLRRKLLLSQRRSVDNIVASSSGNFYL